MIVVDKYHTIGYYVFRLEEKKMMNIRLLMVEVQLMSDKLPGGDMAAELVVRHLRGERDRMVARAPAGSEPQEFTEVHVARMMLNLAALYLGK